MFYINLKYSGKKFGQYTIKEVLGEGRYGLCLLATSETGDKVVIKKYKSVLTQRALQTCVEEAVILSQLNDLRVPNFLGVINEKGFYGFVLDFKKGSTVKELLFKHNHRFQPQEVYTTGLQLIDIIQYLHENGVVHRDIRIPNVVIDEGKVSLIDFGLARWADHSYQYDLDYSYLGDFLLYLLYSSYDKDNRNKLLSWSKELPWYEELELTKVQVIMLKKLLGLNPLYENIDHIRTDFVHAFST